MQFLIGSGTQRQKRNHFSLEFISLCITAFLFSCPKKTTKGLSKSEDFVLKIGQYMCQKIQNVVPISNMNKCFRKVQLKKVRHKKKRFFLVTLEIIFFLVHFLLHVPSDLK
jgi:hypothetical protein